MIDECWLVAGELSTEVRERRQAEGSFDDRKVVCYYANWAAYRKVGYG